jgi:hypothetical protein
MIFDATDLGGARRFFASGRSFFVDASFVNGTIIGTGASGSHSRVPFYCDMAGLPPGAPFNPGGGICSDDPNVSCTFNTDCGSVAIGATCDGLTYCHRSVNAPGQPGFIWNDPNYVNDPNLACPPSCGTTYDFNTFEQEEIERVGAIDRNAGIQLALDNLRDPRAGLGDAVTVRSLFQFLWIGDADLRCSVTGSPGAPAGEVGRCSVSPRTCNPDRGPGQPFKLGSCSVTVATACNADTECPATETCVGGCPAGETCDRCNTSRNQAGLCTQADPNNPGLNQSCQVNADCAAGSCSYAHLNPLPTRGGNHLNQPGAYDDGGFLALRLGATNPSGLPRIGLLDSRPPDVRIPLYLVGATGDVAAEFRDSDVGANDTAELGRTTGGGTGIGTAQTFASGQFLPWRTGLGTNTASQEIPVFADNPGTPLGLLVRSYEWGSGVDGITGCIGDNSTLGPCTARRGIVANPGNTGLDDPSLRGAEIEGCNLTCIGLDSPQRRNPCPLAGVKCDTTPGGSNDQQSASICGCGGLDATHNAADVLPDPQAHLPTLRLVSAATARDVTVFNTKDSDWVFKERTVSCPWKGNCSTTTSDVCADAGDCPATETCVNMALRCAAPADPCPGVLGGDSDGDGICDNGDGTGTAGDNPCTGGATASCDDNCRYEWNPDQADTGSVANFGPDGIGTVCQCGDANNDGRITLADFGLIRGFFLNGATAKPIPAFQPQKADASGDLRVTLADFGRVRGCFLTGMPCPGLIIQGCLPAVP